MAAAATLAACAQKEDPTKVLKVTVKPSEITITEGTTKTLQYEVEPATAVYDELAWSTDDSKVAKISRKGLLTANQRCHWRMCGEGHRFHQPCHRSRS